MATDVTIAGLFGTNSKVSVNGITPIIPVQEFTFPGLYQNSVFIMSLGRSGWVWEWSGLLRSANSVTITAAAASLNAIVAQIETYQRDCTLLNIGTADSTNTALLYRGSAGNIPNVVIVAFGLTGSRAWSGVNPNVIASHGFQMVMRRLT